MRASEYMAASEYMHYSIRDQSDMMKDGGGGASGVVRVWLGRNPAGFHFYGYLSKYNPAGASCHNLP